MATSSPSVINLDLNLALTAQPNVMPSVWLDVPDAHPAVPAICPNLSLTFDNRPITLHDSVLLHDSTAVAVAKGFVLPRDRALLTDKSDTDVVNDSLAFSIQGAVSTSDMARRLLVRNEEMGFLEKSNCGITTNAQILQAKAHGTEPGKYSAEKVGIIIR
jgi:hypothetical protein